MVEKKNEGKEKMDEKKMGSQKCLRPNWRENSGAKWMGLILILLRARLFIHLQPILTTLDGLECAMGVWKE